MTRPPSVTVMVVDDDLNACWTLERILAKEGYRVITAGSGQEALARAGEARPDITLLDITMPDMDGIETLRELRVHGHSQPVIMLTGQGTLQTAREAMLLGAYDYVTKPYNVAFLKAVLREALQAPPAEQRESVCAR